MASNTNNSDNTTDAENTDSLPNDARIVDHNIPATSPNPDYELDRDENPGLQTAYVAQLLDDYPLLMHIVQAAAHEELITESTVYDYLDADAVSRNDVQEALWLLERLDVLSTDDHSKYLPRTSSDIYMNFYAISTEGYGAEPEDRSAAIDLRKFTLPRLLVLDLLLSNYHHGGFTMQELETNWDIPVSVSADALQWLLDNDFVVAKADESYTVNINNRNAKKIRDIQKKLPLFGGAILHHDTSATYDYFDTHKE